MLPEGHLIGWVNSTPKKGVAEKTQSKWIRFKISCEDTFKHTKEENKKVVYFFDCVAWGKAAEILGEQLKEGELLHMTYYLTNSRYMTAEGNWRQRAELTVRSFFMLGQKSFEVLKQQEYNPSTVNLPQLKTECKEEVHTPEKVDLVTPVVEEKKQKGGFADVYKRYGEFKSKWDDEETKPVEQITQTRVEDCLISAEDEEDFTRNMQDFETGRSKTTIENKNKDLLE